jgi:hypothetical protein
VGVGVCGFLSETKTQEILETKRASPACLVRFLPGKKRRFPGSSVVGFFWAKIAYITFPHVKDELEYADNN